MKKALAVTLSAVLALGLASVPATAFAEEGGEWRADEAELSAWRKVAEGGTATVELESSSEHGEEGSLHVSVEKHGDAFAGVRAEIGEKISAAAEEYNSLIGISFKSYNALALPAGNEIAVKIGFGDKEWNVAENQADAFPVLTETGEGSVSVNFSYLPEGFAAADADSLTIGVNGQDDAELYLYDFELAYSDEEMITERISVPTAQSIASIGFGCFQYGGAEGTYTATEKQTLADKSKESDGSTMLVSVAGEGDPAGRIYSVYFPLSAQKSAVTLNNPQAVSFWIYNNTAIGGGLLFKVAGTELTSGIKLYDGENVELTEQENNRNLDYTGFRRYEIALSADQLAANELEIGIWGATNQTSYHLSAFSFTDLSIPQAVESAGSETLIGASAENFTKVDAKLEAELSVKDSALYFTARKQGTDGTVYIERSLNGIFAATDTELELTFKADRAYGGSVLAIDLLYDDGSGVAAAYRAVKGVTFADAEETSVTVSLADLPYFISSAGLKGLRIVAVGSEEFTGVSLCGLRATGSGAAKESYSYAIADFESASQVAQWGVSYASGTSAQVAHNTQNKKVGSGALSYRFENALYDFGWTEIYLDVGDIISANRDSGINGISFWLYNESYIEPGALGFWLKVAQSDNPEFEVKYDHVITENNTNNSLGFTGWQKVEIPFTPAAFNEQTYYSGYDSSNPKSFDWTKLQYIKIGFWGTYFDAANGYSCNTVLDDVRLVSAKPMGGGSEESFSITYHLNGGTLPDGAKTAYTAGEAFELPKPTRSGYDFAGWYTSNALTGDAVTAIKSDDSGSMTFYAAWKESDKAPVGLIVGLSVGGAVVLGGVVAGTVIFVKRKRKA